MIWQVLFGTVGETIGRKAKYVTFIGIKKYQAKTLQYCLQEHVFKCPQAESFSLHRENHPGPQQPISLKHCYLGSLEMCLLAFKTHTSTKQHILPPFDGNQWLCELPFNKAIYFQKVFLLATTKMKHFLED